MTADSETHFGSKVWQDGLVYDGINLYDVLISSKTRTIITYIEKIINVGRQHIGFSSKYASFEDWTKAYKGDKSKRYYQRIKNAVQRGASTLEEARGKKSELQQVIREEQREIRTEVTPEWDNWEKERYNAFLELRMYMIEQLRNSWKSDIDDVISLADEISSDEDMQAESIHLSWDMIDPDGDIIYFWKYENGDISGEMWTNFSFSRLMHKIKKSGIW